MIRKFAATTGIAAIAVISFQSADEAAARPALVQGSDNGSKATVSSSAAIRFVTAAQGNSARYRIREQLVGIDLPNDAVGETGGVAGAIAVDARGRIIPGESKFTVDVSALKSDKDRRDNFVRRRVLLTEQHPTVTFVPKSARGISLPLPASGRRAFELIGDLTVRGETRQVAWKVDARFQPSRVSGAATTSFKFSDFDIEQPRVPVVLSVDETIKLELDFTLVRAPQSR